ncbi:MAG: hypothetical protein ACI4U4_05590 [Bacilli bacterium]
MLESYKIGQPIFYNIVMNAIKNDKISHAYIFDSNGNPDAIDMIFSFVKEIICKDINDKNTIENVCRRIDDGNYVDVKVIEPDGLWIKKDQLLDLQSEFSNKALEGNKKIYIIKSAEKMNVQTSNSILKFLEEPVDDIIAILLVENINLLLPTIISRCQIIKLNKKKYSLNVVDNLSDILIMYGCNDISLESKNKIIDDVINFVQSIEFNSFDTLIFTKKLWHNNFIDRNNNIIAIDLLIRFYYDIIRYKCNLNILFFIGYNDKISEIAEKNDIIKLCEKIDCLNIVKSNIKCNMNINLLIDKLILDMCGDN